MVSSGFITANFGRRMSPPAARLRFSGSRFTTLFGEPSLPAAAIVSTTPTGSAAGIAGLTFTSRPTEYRRHSPPFAAPMAIAFDESTTLPPPTASRKSTPSAMASRTPSSMSELRGLGFTPPSSTKPTPASASDALTRSRSPLRTAEPPP